MHNHIPKVHIMYSYFLDEDRRELYKLKEIEYPKREEVLERFEKTKELWVEYNEDDQLIKKIAEVLGVCPQYDFEFYVYGSGFTPMSVPLLMPLFNKDGPRTDNKLVDTLVHELIHRFVSWSRPEMSYSPKEYWNYIGETYSDLPKSAQNHLIVYAVLEKVLAIIFDKQEIIDLQNTMLDTNYKIAINMVREKGADYFINEFKEHIVKM